MEFVRIFAAVTLLVMIASPMQCNAASAVVVPIPTVPKLMRTVFDADAMHDVPNRV